MARINILILLLALMATLQGESPDFIIVGAHKSGTTCLIQTLKRHPNIAAAKGEVHYFSGLFHEKDTSWYEAQIPLRTEERFLVGEKSADYLCCWDAPSRIAGLYPNVKIIAILRNPVDKAYSHYWMCIRNGKNLPPFDELVRLHLTHKKSSSLLSNSLYSTYLENWFDWFPEEQILILLLDDLANKPTETLSRVFDFLHLPPCEELMPVNRNEYKKSYPPMNPETREKLKEYYKPSIQELESLLNRQTQWN